METTSTWTPQLARIHTVVRQWAAVVGRAVADNEEVVAFIEVAPDTALDIARLQKYLRERLSPYKIPAEIRVLHQLPAAPTGKLLKHVLKQMAAVQQAA
ncbi:MAG: long-chain fatty acid--CoA ligase [Burkholderia sp.]|jgi:acyl-CoA synthetase (AMP-forming)/AMP-acid ligase II|nr:long-chain fatty acid--CoA ligase [Burkholderia sp.]